MRLFTLRGRRITVEVPVQVALQKRKNSAVTIKRQHGVVTNISKSGACIVVQSVVVEGEHLFFSAQKDGDNYLYLAGLSMGSKDFSVSAKVISMDTCTRNNTNGFKLGVEFVNEQKELFDYLKKTA